MKTVFNHLFVLGLVALISTLVNTPVQGQLMHKTVDEAKGLKIGQKAPEIKATDQFGNKFKLSKTLNEGPVVVIFYRGQWCPICNKTLAQLQDSLEFIQKAGGRVLAISPEKPEYIEKTLEKTGATYTVIYDEAYKISEAFDVVFLPEEKMRNAYNSRLGADLKNAHSDDSERLPIPATFIVGQDGKIKWRHFDPDYKARATINEIVAALESM